jgi:hypothetical protein
MKAEIDAIIGDFAPEMERITALTESKECKVQIAEAWLRCRLERFETKIRADCAKKRQ